MTAFQRLQFSLRSLLTGLTVCVVAAAIAGALGWELIAEFSKGAVSLGAVLLLALSLIPFDGILAKLPFAVSFALVPIGYCGLAFTFFVLGEAIDQPHPIYTGSVTWLSVAIEHALRELPLFAIATPFLVGVDAVTQCGRPRDRGYYPRIVNVWRSLAVWKVRWVLIAGGLLLGGMYASTVIDVWSAHHQPHGLIWPPKRVYETCLLFWGLLWLADCVARPRGGTMAAAVGYLCFFVLVVLGRGSYTLVE